MTFSNFFLFLSSRRAVHQTAMLFSAFLQQAAHSMRIKYILKLKKQLIIYHSDILYQQTDFQVIFTALGVYTAKNIF